MHPSMMGSSMSQRERLSGDDDDKNSTEEFDTHALIQEIAEHGVNTPEEKEDDGPFDESAT